MTMTQDIVNRGTYRLEAIDEVCLLLRRALDRLDSVDAGIVAAPEIDLALHHLKIERERIRSGSIIEQVLIQTRQRPSLD